MTPSDALQVGRLAFRREGERVHAYWARTETMDGAVWIGSILVSVCDAEPAVWDGFKNLMRDAFSGVVFQDMGIRPAWGGEQPAPEHERAGRA
jgi:hypothetical protein